MRRPAIFRERPAEGPKVGFWVHGVWCVLGCFGVFGVLGGVLGCLGVFGGVRGCSGVFGGVRGLRMWGFRGWL